MTQPDSSSSSPGRPYVPPTPPAPSAAPPRGRKASAEKDGGVKETIESILVAFILAFIFRAFVVEAFVIPTGSMAPTLLGAHMRFGCQDCGYRFDANYSPTQSGGDLHIPTQSSHTYRVFCPNCGYKLPQVDPDDADNRTSKPPVHYGDRILVLKYLYLFEEAQRWDVVVFKSPAAEDESKPPQYTQNYIKRLVGKPNESVLILDGDIYVGQPGQEVNDFTIQTKPRYVQEALWRIIYDHDYVPRKLMRSDGSKWEQPWKVRGGAGWKIGDTPTPQGRTFNFENASGESTIYFDRNANPIAERGQHDARPYAFTDWLAYDVELPADHNIVRDLKLQFVYDRAAGEGTLRAKLTRAGDGSDAFLAVISPTDAQLVHRSAAGEKRIGQAMPLPQKRRPIRVELSNVDYEAMLLIDGVEVARTTPQDYRPDVGQLLKEYEAETDRLTKSAAPPAPQPPTVEITAASQTAVLSHVSLWRDIYYINRKVAGSVGNLYWGTPAKIPDSIMRLGPDEYFVLGDNSLISGDARYWHVPINLLADDLYVERGRVPGRFMLGRAFFVYWPAGYRPAAWAPGLAPNFGDMRFIR